MKNCKKNKGFTLAEALITLVILGVIGTIVIPQILAYNPTEKSLATKADKVVGIIEQANLEILLNHSSYDDFTRLKYLDDTYFSIEDSNITTKMSNLYKNYISVSAKSVDTTSDYFTSAIKNYKRTALETVLGTDYSDFFFTNDGVLIGFRYYGSCSSTENNANPPGHTEPYSVSDICGSIFYDVNAYTKPNKLGSDQYIIPIYKRGSKYSNDSI